MAAKQILVYDNWSKGDLGRRAPAPNTPGTYAGRNVFVYPNGSIGPRPGFIPQVMSALPARRVTHMIYNDANDCIVFITTELKVYKFTPPQTSTLNTPSVLPTITLIGTLAAAITSMVSSGNHIYCCRSASITTGGVDIDVSANSITAVAAVHTGNLIQVFGTRFVVVENDTGTTKNRLHYSAANDFTTWPGNFTDVGTATKINSLFVQRNSLSISKVDGVWWNVTGVLGAETVRRVAKGLTYSEPSVLTNGDNIWWPNGKDMGIFSGAEIRTELRPQEETYIGPNAEHSPEDIAFLSDSDDLLIVGSTYDPNGPVNGIEGSNPGATLVAYAQSRIGGVWNRHTIPATLYNGLNAGNLLVEGYTGGKVIVCQRGRDSTMSLAAVAPTFYVWDPRTELPSVTGVDGDAGANVVGSFSTDEYWPKDDSKCIIKAVYVDLGFDNDLAVARQATPAAYTVGFTVTATSVNRVSSDNGGDSQSLPWLPPDAVRAYSVTGARLVRQRAVFNFGDQGEGAGTLLTFSNITNVNIFRVVIEIEEVPANGS